MASETAGGFAVSYIPTWRQRQLRKLGFRFHLGADPDDGRENLPGWMFTETLFEFTLADRLCLLVSGRLRTRTISFINTPTPSEIKNRVDWEILAPGQD